jgi:hypothetical protein
MTSQVQPLPQPLQGYQVTVTYKDGMQENLIGLSYNVANDILVVKFYDDITSVPFSGIRRWRARWVSIVPQQAPQTVSENLTEEMKKPGIVAMLEAEKKGEEK